MNSELKETMTKTVVITLSTEEAQAMQKEIAQASTYVSYLKMPGLDKLEDHLIRLVGE